jgi:hypothetical protein
MKVLLYFQRPKGREPESPRFIMYGKYASTGFLFVKEDEIVSFGNTHEMPFSNKVFRNRPNNLSIKESNETYDFLLLSLEEDEKTRILSTCEALVTVRKPYNLLDLLLIHVPFRDIPELSVTDAPSLNNAQAVIAILRECLNQENALCNGLHGLHSRQTFIETIYERVRPYTLLVEWSSLLALVRWPQ